MGVMEYIMMGLPQQNQKTYALAIFPNPLDFNSVCEMELPLPGTVQISIFDLNGRMVWQQTHENMSAGTNHFSLEDFVKNHPKNNRPWLLKITSGSHTQASRLIY